MASQIGISVGKLSSVRNFSNDVRVRDTLLRFYMSQSLGPETATNQEKLDAVVGWIVMQIVEGARQYEHIVRRDAAAAEIIESIGLE